MLSAFIAGLAGSQLDAREAALLRAARPCGVILFARNVQNPEQVRRLTDAVRAWGAHGNDTLALPHPSPRNNRWLKHNPWFERELVPALRTRVVEALADRG